MHLLSGWLEQYLAHLGYAEIFFLMALESSLFPVPSELVMIPAGYLIAQQQLDPLLALAAGACGSLAGASANYVLGRYAGRVFLLRYGRYFLVSEAKYHEAERLFLRNARWATFVGRLIPVIRHLISLPAGVFGMPLAPFALLTTLGAALWCGILLAVGYHFGEAAAVVMRHYANEIGVAALLLLGVLGLRFLLKNRGSRPDPRR
ncbi:membrane protein DedA, SNARE-associated domain [Solimonas aquatica]|uniref:Membrane protein DedA, SNARE-associated domain n=1 Tax=Solimonas aquatica TaxID=489703 RepID=A0A1H9AJR6_9GAMM|nr:DedA family protein [Solimonas aquatica]SEP76208.1 membrane protein DedA, SNARE-associated domain [Solimonas aquatica]